MAPKGNAGKAIVAVGRQLIGSIWKPLIVEPLGEGLFLLKESNVDAIPYVNRDGRICASCQRPQADLVGLRSWSAPSVVLAKCCTTLKHKVIGIPQTVLALSKPVLTVQIANLLWLILILAKHNDFAVGAVQAQRRKHLGCES